MSAENFNNESILELSDDTVNNNTDPLFKQETRPTVFPVKYPTLRSCLLRQRGCFWQTHEVSLINDQKDWKKLNKDEQHFIKMVLAFFATSDIIVNTNLSKRFTQEISIHEVQMLYNYQKMMEDIHSEMYALLIETYISDKTEKEQILNAIETVPIIKKKAQWAYKWIQSDAPYVNRLIAFVAIEGVFFSGSFCAIYWLKERGVLKGLTLSNDYISRDEGQHVETAIEIYNLLKNKIEFETFKNIIQSAVELEIEFITEALPCKLIGMNSASMTQYIKFVANRLSKQFGFNELYNNIEQPFPFMDRICLNNKSNFFEGRPSEYNKLAIEDEEDDYADL